LKETSAKVQEERYCQRYHFGSELATLAGSFFARDSVFVVELQCFVQFGGSYDVNDI
jgi:hypothetical protein